MWLLHKLMAPVKCMRLSMVQCIVLRHTRQEEVTSRFVQQPEVSDKKVQGEGRDAVLCGAMHGTATL